MTETKSERLVKLQIAPPIASLTLNRPERHNSLIPELLEQFLEALETIRKRADLRAVVLGANGRSFSTGGDIAGFYEHLDDLEAYAEEIVGLLNQAILELVELPIPVVAAVHGLVTGGSLGLVLACDVVLVTPQASFAPYYGVVGFSPDGGWTALLPSLIGPKRAAESLMTNRAITAEEAVALGLANRLLRAEELQQEAFNIVHSMAGMKPGTLRSVKRLLGDSYGDLASRLEQERASFVAQVSRPEAIHGIRDFVGQRSRDRWK
jgi:2-(1,2-epoxy-1,2-dihydrophenyl)acetyl-CoA isomerase